MDNGNWTGNDGGVQIAWSMSCIDTVTPGLHVPVIGPVTSYTVGNGDLFGTSQERQFLTYGYVEILDCGGAVMFTLWEKVYKQEGKPDTDACTKYRSCDGVIYLQYFLKDKQDKVVAMTPYLTIFQESFDITDSVGAVIAQASRNGWHPGDVPLEGCSTSKPRLWNLKYSSSPPGIWANVPSQWPIAAMMQMIANHDQHRQPNGAVLWSNCETLKASGWIMSLFLGFCCCMCIPMVLFLSCSGLILSFVNEGEQRLFPKRMGKPSIYGN
jgi:hypothetical protein